MARKRKVDVIEHDPKPVPQEVPPVPEAPSAFEAVVSAAWRPNTRGRVSIYNPLYVPPGVKLAMFLAPGGVHGSTDYAQAKHSGWIPLPPELVTDDPEKAEAEGKVALLAYDVVDGLVRVGEHVVMFQLEKDWYRQYYADLQTLASVTTYTRMGVNVEEWKEQEVTAPIKDDSV